MKTMRMKRTTESPAITKAYRTFEQGTEAYESYELRHPSLECGFCQGGPLDCECEDVSMVLEEDLDEDLDEALADTGRSFEAVTKLGRAKTEQLLGELSLDSRESSSWKTIESMTMWL